MAHPRTLSAAVLPAALLLLTTCGHDVTAPPAPTQLAFLQQPANLVAGHRFTQAVKVRAEDAHGNKVASFTGNVTVALANNPGGSTLGGTTTVAAVDGIATFSDLSLDKTGAGYTLTASASGGGLAAPTSAAFDVAPGPATHLEFTVEPSTATAGAALAPPLQVTARDGAGNLVPTFTGNVIVAFGGTSGAGLTLGGTTTVAAVNGVATFRDLTVSQTGSGYWLTASATGLARAASSAFDVTPGAATQLVFGTEPRTTVADHQISPAVKVRALDALGNLVPSFTGSVSIAVGNNPGGATLSGTTPVAAVSGVATFFDLSLNKTGTGYRLTASASGFAPVASTAFDITPGVATQLAFIVQPSNTVAGAAISPAVQVTALDGAGNPVPGFTGSITVALGNNPGGSTLGGTTTVTAVNGVAGLSSLTLDKTGTGYWLTATATGLSTATSGGFNITPGAATQLVFGTEPRTTVADHQISPAVKVRALDALGNLVPSFTGSVSIAVGNNPGGATFSGTTPVAAVGGVATFFDLSLNKTGTGYTLTASSSGFAPVTSTAFDITPGTARQLAFTQEPGTTVAGVAISPTVQVTALDGAGNPVPGFTSSITVALGNNPGGSTLGGTTTAAALNGVASFSTLTLDKTGTGYWLTATATGLSTATSSGFNITPGAATQLVFGTEPGTTVANRPITPAVKVRALDTFGNVATGFTGAVAVALGSNPGSGTLSGTTPVAAVGGVATFFDFSLNKTGTGYTLTASASGFAPVTSTAFDITPGTATQLAFTVQPSNTVAGAAISPAVQVTALDGAGNPVPGFTGSVTVVLGSNPGGSTLGGTTTVATVSGIVSFPTLTLDKTGTSYSLTATAIGLNTATSSGFNITPGTATQLVFSQQPGTTVANHQISPAVKVRALDAFGNVATGFTDLVTLALGNNPGNATLSGTTPVAAVNGVATFFVSLNKAATGYTLTASASGFAPVTSTAFDITPGTATQLAFTVQPSTTVAGAAISPAVQVTALDPAGNPVPGFTGTVTVVLGSNPGGSTLGGTTTVAAVNGVASFSTLTLDKTGTSYWLTATAAGLSTATSSSFNITAGVATQLVFGTQPSTTVANRLITPAVKVRALDALGNLVLTFAGSVTVALGTNPGGSTLSGTTPVTAVGGVATFGDLSLNKTGTGYTLTASASGFAPVTSTVFDIIPGTATHLAFTQQPSTTVAGAAISPSVQVTALDPAGNLVPSFTGSVTVALGSNPGGSTLGGTTTVAAVGGVATFFVSLNKVGTGYTLTASASGLTPMTSTAFDITPGTATQLAFTVQPSNAVAGAAISPAVRVTALDPAGNPVPSFTGSVTVALGSNPGSSTLGGTTTVAAVNGVASFPTLTLDKTGTSYSLTATATGLSPATSNGFNITPGAATQLVFGTQPGTTVADHQISPAVKVRALDALGNLAPSFTGSVTVALGNNPGGSTLSGTTPVAAVNGVATFFVSLNKAGTGYTLTASASGFASVTSSPFDIIPGTATQLAFTQQPSTTVAGAAISPAVQVTALDPAGNPVPSFTGSVTVSLGSNPGGSTLGGTTTVAAANGVASFSTLTLDKTGTSYWLTATTTGLPAATSSGFNITAGVATQLVFGTQPSTTVANHQISPAVKARALDAFGNVATGFTDLVTLALGNNPGNATLSGTTPVAAVSGVATFFVSLNKAGTGYTLTASASGLAPVTSTAFDITPGTATQWAFTQQPSTTVAGAAISPAVQVTALDPAGNPVPSFTGSVTVSLGSNPGGSTLGGTTTVAAVNGVASFSTLTLDKTGTSYWLTATGTGLSTATSNGFNITAGVATQLVFGTQPSTTVASHQISPAVKVRALDAFGNVATGFTDLVTLALGNNPGNATLSGTTPVAAVNGVATFFVSLNKAGTGYTLTASASGFATVTSTTFDITPGTATQLAFTVQPTNTVAGGAITPAVQVTALDPAGNLVPGFTGSITVALANNPGGSTLGGTTTVAAVNGVASFGDLTADKTGAGYWLTATATGLAKATSSAFTITPGAATQLVFGTQPGTTVASNLISPAVKVRALDAFGNVVTGFTDAVAVALGSNPGGATLSGTTPVAAVNGIATFFLSLDKVGTGYTLTASAGALGPVTSSAFDVIPGTATHLAFTQQPSTTVAGVAISPAVQVTALDPAGNPVPGFTGNVTVALGNNSGGGTLGGTTTVAAVNGVATFSDLTLDKTGAGYWLTVTATGFSATTSSVFAITAGAATQVVFGTQPGTTVANSHISPAVKVRALDAFGNVATGFSGAVAIALGSNPGGGTLSGTTSVAAANGIATFDLSVNKAGTGYTLVASVVGFAPVTSTAFDITPGTATQLTFTVQPSNTVAGGAISPAVQVAALDPAGNPVPAFTGDVTVTFGNNPGGSTLGGTTTVAAVNGVARFWDLSPNKAGTRYWLTATATGLNRATSSVFDVTPGAATQLVFGTQPGTTVAGQQITPAVKVRALDALGNVATGFTGAVTVAIGSNAGGATLSGTILVAAVGGVASFGDLSLNRTATGYTLTASGGGLSPVTSTAFDITPGTATRLAFTQQPTNTVAGGVISPAVQLSALDPAGNLVPTFTGNVTVALGNNPGGSTLGGTTTAAAVGGVVTFSDLTLDKTAPGYWLTATGLGTGTSSSFNIIAGTATQLVFGTQPGTITGGKSFSPAVKVRALDGLGNLATTFTGEVTVTLNSPGSGTLSGTTTVAAAGGVATFFSLSVNAAASGYTLTAAAAGLPNVESVAFDVIVGPASHLDFQTRPHDEIAGGILGSPYIQLRAEDTGGNLVTSFTGLVTVAIAANPGGGTLSGTTTVAAVGGRATFSDLSIDKVGTGYTLGFSADGLLGVTSATFNITPAAASRLVFTVQPTSTAAGATITPAVEVTAYDSFGNLATGFTGGVTLTIGSNPGGGTLNGTTTVTAAAGVASFASLSINNAGAGYTLLAGAGALAGATSVTFDVN